MTLEHTLIPHDQQVSFEFIRFITEQKPASLKQALEGLFGAIQEDATQAFLSSLKAAHRNPLVDFNSYLAGVIGGVALASGSAKVDGKTLRGFLQDQQTKRGNVADISDAFRKKQACST